MIRLLLFFVAVAAIAWGMSWLADRPGQIFINWQGREVEVSVFHAVIALATLLGLVVLVWSVLRQLMHSPTAISNNFKRRAQKRGIDALSTGIIAIGAGDQELATRYAAQARRSMPHEPLTDLLRAQAAQLAGDHATARRIYEAMLASPDTEQLGLRGLFLEATKQGETEAARQLTQRAVKLNPKLDWAVNALFELQCKDENWASALSTLSIARKNGHADKKVAARRRAVLLTAQAQEAEEGDMDHALQLALEANKLADDLVPAAEIAGRLLASKGNTAKAASVLTKTWRRSPHPDLAIAYAFARPGDSPQDRLKRVKDLAALSPHNIESPIAVAQAMIEAHDWKGAREALEPLLEKRLTQRVCTLMARIEGGEYGDRGRVREWLARAVNAPRDPAWTADGYVSDTWAPISPISGELDAFEWKVPVEPLDKKSTALMLEELLPLARGDDQLLEAGQTKRDAVDAEPVDVGDLQTIGAPHKREVVTKTVIAKEPLKAHGIETVATPETSTTAGVKLNEPDGKSGSNEKRKKSVERNNDDGGDTPSHPTTQAESPHQLQGSQSATSSTAHPRTSAANRTFVSPRAAGEAGPRVVQNERAPTPPPALGLAPAKG